MFFKPKQWSALLAGLVFLVSWYVFITTAPVSITFEDSGELATEPYILGSGHPSGQPIHTVLGRVVTLAPLGPISWRTNLYSSLASALALVLLFLVYLKLGEALDVNKEPEFYYLRLVSGVCVCLFTIFSLDYWLQSILTEVYALNAFFFILAMYIALLFQETDKTEYLYLLGFTLGLSMGNHHTTIFLLPALFYLVLYKRWRILLDPKAALVIIGLAVIGFSIYLEMPLRAASDALVNWGDAQTLPRFMETLFRKQYRPIMVERDGAAFLRQLGFFGFSIQQTFFWVWLSLIGMAYLVIRLSRQAIFVLTLFITYTIGFVYLINPDIPEALPFLLRTFYMHPYMLLAMMTGLGLLAFMEFIYWLDKNFNWQLKEHLLYFSLLLLLLPALPARANYPQVNRRYYYYAYDYANNMLKSIKPNGLMFTIYAQDTFPLWYSQFVEGKRPDIVVVHQRLFINDWFQLMTKTFHPTMDLELTALKREGRVPFYQFADMLQEELIRFNQERPAFSSQYCGDIMGRNFNLVKKGAVFEFITPRRDYSKDFDPRYYYFYRGFDQYSKYYQMEMRAVEIVRSSYLN